MTVQYIVLETIEEIAIARLYADIKKRIVWNDEQLSTLNNLKRRNVRTDHRYYMGYNKRIENYRNAIKEYKTDLFMIDSFLNKTE